LAASDLRGAAIRDRRKRVQQATFADASRVFVLSVRHQDANPAARGQFQPVIVQE
jgi:hypothetical protein